MNFHSPRKSDIGAVVSKRSHHTWTVDEIVAELHKQLPYPRISNTSHALIHAVRKNFGTWRNGLTAAGYDVSEVYRHGRKMIGAAREKPITIPEHCPDYAYFIGLLVGDGYIRKHPSTGLCVTDEELTDRFHEIGQRLFGVVPRRAVEHPKLRGYGGVLPMYRVNFYSKRMRDELFRETAAKHRVPLWVMNDKGEASAAFIRGFADAEGCFIHKPPRGGCIRIGQKDRDILSVVQYMLDRLGIFSHIPKPDKNGIHSLNISGYYDIKLYYEKVSFGLTRKKELLERYVLENGQDDAHRNGYITRELSRREAYRKVVIQSWTEMGMEV